MQYEVLDILRRGPQRHFDIDAGHRRLLVRLWMCGHVRLRAGDYWEITTSGMALWTECGTLPDACCGASRRHTAAAPRSGGRQYHCIRLAEPSGLRSKRLH